MGFRGLLAVAAVVAVSGCGFIKDMKNDMKGMKETLGDVSRKGDHIAKRTDDLEREMKFKESANMFTYFMNALFGENGSGTVGPDSDRTNPEVELLLYADGGVRALMFQMWKGDYNESTVESLDKDFLLSVEALFVRVGKYIPRDFNLESMIPGRSYKALASLGARLDSTQDSFTKALATKSLPNMSLYTVMLEALRDRDAVEQTGLLPKTKTKILEWKGEAIYILQLRHNYLPMMVLSRISDFPDRNNFERFLMFLEGNQVNLNHADPTKSASNASLIEWTKWLKGAVQTRAQLKEIGIQPKYNPVFGKLLKSLNFGQQDILNGRYRSSGDVRRDQLIKEFAAVYTKVVSEMPSSLLGMPNGFTGRSEQNPARPPGLIPDAASVMPAPVSP